MDVEHHRKDAKRLARAFRAGESEALARAERVLGQRARQRFVLGDAQHVVAAEHGYRSWPELRRTVEVDERVVDTGLEYAPGDPVRVRVVRRDRRTGVSDGGAAVERAGRPAGWREVADRIGDETVVNVSRQGVISLPVSRRGPGLDALVARVGDASLALYQEILDLDA